MPASTDRHLLFGLLALQNGIISQVQLVAAFHAWTLDKSKSLADHLEARGDLTGARRALLEGLAEMHLGVHGGDAEKSLAAVSASRSIMESLARIADPEINATLGHVGLPSARPTTTTLIAPVTYSVGSATSEGQRFRVLRPHARGGLARCSWRSTPSSTARWRSSRYSTSMPTTPPAGNDFSWKPRSPAG